MSDFARSAKGVILIAAVIAGIYVIDSRETNDSGGLIEEAARKPLSNLTIRSLDGTLWRLNDHRGAAVLVNFWATWCAPCREETPDLVHLAGSYSRDELEIIGVSMDESRPATVRNFIALYKVPYTIAERDDNFALSSAVAALPTTLLIDKQGRIAKKFVGATSERVFRTDIETLLHEGRIDSAK
jgi:cytochrome c biogenesis protein CcmG, thiol:disulfide interchange protein DsbE